MFVCVCIFEICILAPFLFFVKVNRARFKFILHWPTSGSCFFRALLPVSPKITATRDESRTTTKCQPPETCLAYVSFPFQIRKSNILAGQTGRQTDGQTLTLFTCNTESMASRFWYSSPWISRLVRQDMNILLQFLCSFLCMFFFQIGLKCC